MKPVKLALLLMALAALAEARVAAHPMGNFSINHYARLTAQRAQVTLLYVLDMAEIPTVTAKSALDADGNGVVTEGEKRAYLREKCGGLCEQVQIRVDGRRMPLTPQQEALALRPGAAQLDTLRITFTVTVPLPGTPPASGFRIEYRDDNYRERTGWKEIVVVGGQGAQLLSADAPADDLSQALTVYPTDPAIAPPQRTTAHFVVSVAGPDTPPAIAASAPADFAPAVSGVNRGTPQDAFTQSIATKQLTPVTLAVALGLAFVFGALHALSPGHGKAMVAAYLVGARGTVRHALLLGGVVTLTHTVGVFLLGLATLIASRYLLPERLYPILSALSGTTVLLLGLGLLAQRWRTWRGKSEHDAGDYDGFEDERARFDPVPTSSEEAGFPTAVPFPIGEVKHDMEDTGAISTRTLIALGITGGALPCPSALVVLLSAVALHRVVLGMVLIVAFSLGLALVLTAIGVLVVRSRGLLARAPASNRWRGALVLALPVFSAAAITVIGCYLLLTAVTAR